MKSFLKRGLVFGVFALGSSINLFAKGLEVYPGQEWLEISAADAQVKQTKIDTLFDLSFEDSATQGVVLIKNGLLIGERYAE